MKINEPVTEEQHKIADEEHSRIAKSQKDYLRSIADSLESGAPLDDHQLSWAVFFLRRAADKLISEIRPKPRGKPIKLPEHSAMEYAIWVVGGMSENKAMEKIAEQYQVSIEAVKKKYGKAGTPEQRAKGAKLLDEAFFMVGGGYREN